MAYAILAENPAPAPTLSAMDDNALLAEIARDNKIAFRALSLRYLTKICRIAYRLTGNRQDAEDVTQEVFVTVWNHRHQWTATGDARFSTWLYRVALNRGIDHRRKRKPQSVEITEEMVESDDMLAEDMVSNRQTQEMLLSCLQQLPENQMRALIYCYYEDMEIPTICLRLDASEDAVRSLLKRGKANLRAILTARTGNDQTLITSAAPYLVG